MSTRVIVNPWILLCWVVACILGGCAAPTNHVIEPPAPAALNTIPDVVSLNDLRRLPSTHLITPAGADQAGTCEARIGLADSGPDGGPWKILYCLVSGTDKSPLRVQNPDGKNHRAALGPVCLTIDEGVPDESEIDRMFHLPIADESPVDADERLYAISFPVAWIGKYRIQLTTRDGQPLRERTISVEHPRPCYWQLFAGRMGGQAPRAFFSVDTKSVAAFPMISGEVPLTNLKGEEMVSKSTSSRLENQFNDARNNGALPGTLPLPHGWKELTRSARVEVPNRGIVVKKSHEDDPEKDDCPPLNMELQDGILVITPPQSLLYWIDYLMLARWWVNGEPVVASRGDGQFQVMLQRDPTYVQQLKAALALPDSLGSLKPGDRVGVQVLYCPDGYLPVAAKRGHGVNPLNALFGPDRLAVPIESNRVEFVVTEAMLAEREAAKVAK